MAGSNDSLGDRMKGYEAASCYVLPLRLPVVIRVDGKAFHTWTRGMDRPFDQRLIAWMDMVALALCEEIQGAKLAYVQSDEVSVLVHNYARLETEAWFDNGLQKTVSVAASVAAASMTSNAGRITHFDARAFVLPEAEVTNYFLWRQQDATRNSIQMLAQSLYSHKELHGKDQSALQEMCFQKGQNWNDLPTHLRRGRCALRDTFEVEGGLRHRWAIDFEIPIWKNEGRAYVERHLPSGRGRRR